MTVEFIPYLLMNGAAAEAIGYYLEVFDAKLLFKQTIGEGPADEAARFQKDELDYIAHSVLKIGDAKLMIADIIPGLPVEKGTQLSICVTSDDPATSERYFNRLKEQGTVVAEFGQVHFSPGYGMVTDKYGVTFQLFTARK